MPVEGSIQAEGCSIQVEGFLSSCVAEPSFGHDASREWCAVKAPARRSETTAGRGVFVGASPACQRAGPHRLPVVTHRLRAGQRCWAVITLRFIDSVTANRLARRIIQNCA
jgi:hypothetical protein